MLITYTLVFLLAAIPFIEAIAVVPIAIVGGLPAIPVMITGFIGNLVTIILLIIFLDKIREWRRKKKSQEETETKRHRRAKALWDKYGLLGLIYIGPFFVGSHLSALLAITFGAERTKILYLMTSSIFMWTVVLGVAALYGFDFLIAGEDNLGFITKFLNN